MTWHHICSFEQGFSKYVITDYYAIPIYKDKKPIDCHFIAILLIMLLMNLKLSQRINKKVIFSHFS